MTPNRQTDYPNQSIPRPSRKNCSNITMSSPLEKGNNARKFQFGNESIDYSEIAREPRSAVLGLKNKSMHASIKLNNEIRRQTKHPSKVENFNTPLNRKSKFLKMSP